MSPISLFTISRLAIKKISEKGVSCLLEDTGERVIPEKMAITNELLIEHLARYHFACRYAKGRVLDIACGSGYGTHIIAKNCKRDIDEVIGVDNDPQVIKYAKNKHFHPQSTYLEGDLIDPSLSEKLGQFHRIISFETIEHLPDEQPFIQHTKQMLTDDGILIVSTPFGKGKGIPSGQPFHYHQFTKEEFREMFSREYKEVEFFFQTGALIVPADFDTEDYYPIGIAVCRK